ncbi:MAG: hypothetical protein N2Z21_04635 [Candidatus Sumerlaeaceae bacterium]|nr:hypothetical protein [Candidatus Sumerlaeaceae bacterium]
MNTADLAQRWRNLFFLISAYVSIFILGCFQSVNAGPSDLYPILSFSPISDTTIQKDAFRPNPFPDKQPVREVACVAELMTSGAAYLGFEASVPSDVIRRYSQLQFSASGLGNARFLELSLISGCSELGQFAVPLHKDRFISYQLPLSQLGANFVETTYQPSSQPYRLRLLVRNVYPGRNGFTLRDVALGPHHTKLHFECPSETTVPIQKHVTFELGVRGGQGSAFSGRIFCYTSSRNEALVPESVTAVAGLARVPLFLRTEGPTSIWFYEPISGEHTSTTLYGIADGLKVHLFAEEFEKQQSIIAPVTLTPRISYEGGNRFPQSVVLSAYDHRGQRQLAQVVSAAALSAGQTKILLPLPGLVELRAEVFAEPLHETIHVPDVFPILVGSRPQDAATSASVALPDGVTTRVVGGYIVTLVDPPTTATRLGEDRLTLWAFTKVPREVRLPLTLFGVDHPDVAKMDIVELAKLARKMFGWQARIGPVWARFIYNYADCVAGPDAYSWPRVQTLAKEAKDRGLRCVVDVPVPPPHVVSAAFSGESDAQTTVTHWVKWLKNYRTAIADKLRIFALRVNAEENSTTSHYPPDLLYGVFKNVYRALDSIGETSPSLLAVFDPPFDPLEFQSHVPHALRDWTEAQMLRPYIPLVNCSPEDNALGDQIDLMRHILRQLNLLRRPLWLGPVGWSSHPLWGDELTQANYLVRLYAIAASHKAQRVFWPQLHDSASYPWEAPPPAFYGLLDGQFRPKPAAIACNLALFMLTSTKPISVQTTGSLVVHSYDIELHSMRWPGKLHIAWVRDERTTASLSIPIGPAGWYAFDYLGAQVDPLQVVPFQPTRDDEETTRLVTFPVTHEPLYIWDVTTIPERTTSKHKCDHQHGGEATGPYTECQQEGTK